MSKLNITSETRLEQILAEYPFLKDDLADTVRAMASDDSPMAAIMLRKATVSEMCAKTGKDEAAFINALTDAVEKFVSNRPDVTGDMLIGRIVRDYPESVETLLSCGMHCLGCPSAQMESLEEACYVHGLDPKAVVELVNKKIKEQ